MGTRLSQGDEASAVFCTDSSQFSGRFEFLRIEFNSIKSTESIEIVENYF